MSRAGVRRSRGVAIPATRWVRTLTAGLAVAALASVVAACGGPEPPVRPEVLATLAGEAIVPRYEEARQALDELAGASQRLCAAPDEALLAETRQALADARRSWKATEAMWAGPVMDRRSWARVDWPPNEDEIRELIDDGAGPTVDARYLQEYVGADQRGLGAAELLLGGDLDSLAGRSCDYIRSAAVVAEAEVGEVLALWAEADVVEQFTEDGVDALVNDAVFLTRRMSDMELGAALGVLDREADLEAIVEGPLGLGVQDGLARLDGLRAVFLGADNTGGLAPLLTDDLIERLDGELADARAAWTAIPPPLRDAAAARPDPVEAARLAVKQLQRTIATEVVSQLGVAVGFSDTDGDSGG